MLKSNYFRYSKKIVLVLLLISVIYTNFVGDMTTVFSANSEGDVVESIVDERGNRAIVDLVGKDYMGIIDGDGNLLPLERNYDYIMWGQDGTRDWFSVSVKTDQLNEYGFRTSKYGMIDINGKKITEIIYDEIYMYDHVLGLAKVKQDNYYGYINKSGVPIIPTKYSSIVYRNGYMLGQDKNDKFGLLSKSNKVLVPFEFDNLFFDDKGILVDSHGVRYAYNIRSNTKSHVKDLGYEIVGDQAIDQPPIGLNLELMT